MNQMHPLNLEKVKEYVENNIGSFHERRLISIDNLSLGKILTRKNPYLFKAKNILTTETLVRTLVDAHLSSQEEAIFGNFLEGLAIFINNMVYGGKKSSTEGIDLEFDKNDIRYIVSIKSGPNWGNSSQIKKMKDNFNKAARILRTSNSGLHIIAVNGCCYGRENKPDRGNHFKYCGQSFWEFISGNSNLYLDIIEPLGFQAKKKNEEFIKSYSRIINKFTFEFNKNFCKNGIIDWEALVKFNSSQKI